MYNKIRLSTFTQTSSSPSWFKYNQIFLKSIETDKASFTVMCFGNLVKEKAYDELFG